MKACSRWLRRATLLATVLQSSSVGEEDQPPLPQRQLQLALTASSPFEMVLSSTASELTSPSLRLIEAAAAQHLLEEQSTLMIVAVSKNGNSELIKTVEIFIQSSNFVAELASATRIRFFALATFQAILSGGAATESPTPEQRQAAVESLVAQSFATETARTLFLQLLASIVAASNITATIVQLQDVDNVAVGPVAPAPNPSGGGGINVGAGEALSALDIVFIVLSAGILLCIVGVICVSCKNPRYYDSSGPAALSNATGSFPHVPTGSFPQFQTGSFPQLDYDEEEELIDEEEVSSADITETVESSQGRLYYVNHESDSKHSVVAEPSISTVSRGDTAINPDYSFPAIGISELRSKELPDLHKTTFDASGNENVDQLAASETPNQNISDGPQQCLPSSSSGKSVSFDDEALSLSEPFENNVFRAAAVVSVRTSTVGNDAPDSSTVDTDSADSIDVFQVDIVKAESMGDSASKHSASRYSASHDIADWMQSIHVVSLTDNKSLPAVATSTDGQSTTTVSVDGSRGSANHSTLESTFLEVSSLGHRSLEQSMASSTPSVERALRMAADV